MKRILMVGLAVVLMVGAIVAYAERGTWSTVIRDTATVTYNTTTTKIFTGVKKLLMYLPSQAGQYEVYYDINDGGTSTRTRWGKLSNIGTTVTGQALPIDIPIPNNGVVKVELNGVAATDTGLTVEFRVFK